MKVTNKTRLTRGFRWGVQIHMKFMNLSEHEALSSAELQNKSISGTPNSCLMLAS